MDENSKGVNQKLDKQQLDKELKNFIGSSSDLKDKLKNYDIDQLRYFIQHISDLADLDIYSDEQMMKFFSDLNISSPICNDDITHIDNFIKKHLIGVNDANKIINTNNGTDAGLRPIESADLHPIEGYVYYEFKPEQHTFSQLGKFTKTINKRTLRNFAREETYYNFEPIKSDQPVKMNEIKNINDLYIAKTTNNAYNEAEKRRQKIVKYFGLINPSKTLSKCLAGFNTIEDCKNFVENNLFFLINKNKPSIPYNYLKNFFDIKNDSSSTKNAIDEEEHSRDTDREKQAYGEKEAIELCKLIDEESQSTPSSGGGNSKKEDVKPNNLRRTTRKSRLKLYTNPGQIMV